MNAFTDNRPATRGDGAATAPDPDECLVSIVIPCLNEAESLPAVLEVAREAIAGIGGDGEIIVADNGSTDGSIEIAQAGGARVAHIAAKGYGSALSGGFAAARGKYILMGDADGSYDFRHVDRFIAALDAGADLVMGNRFAGGIAPGAMPRLHRYFGNPVLSFIGRLFFRAPIGDFNCGLRAFRRDILPRLDLNCDGMEFAVEMVAKTQLYGFRVTEVPTTLAPDLRSGPPHQRTWYYGWRTLRVFLLYSPRWLFFYPGLLLMLLGLIVGVAVLPGTLDVLGARLDVGVLLYAGAAIVVGFQGVTFAGLARVYASAEGFLPESPVMVRLLRIVSLERGLVVGTLLLVAGAVLTVIGFVNWGESSFRHLNYAHEMRIAIPAAVTLMLGVQTILSSFFLSVLELKYRAPTDVAPPAEVTHRPV